MVTVDENDDFLTESLCKILVKSGIDTSDAKFCIIKEQLGRKVISLIPLNGKEYLPTYTRLELAMKIKKMNEKADLHDFSFSYLVNVLIRLQRCENKRKMDYSSSRKPESMNLI